MKSLIVLGGKVLAFLLARKKWCVFILLMMAVHGYWGYVGDSAIGGVAGYTTHNYTLNRIGHGLGIGIVFCILSALILWPLRCLFRYWNRKLPESKILTFAIKIGRITLSTIVILIMLAVVICEWRKGQVRLLIRTYSQLRDYGFSENESYARAMSIIGKSDSDLHRSR